MMGWLALFRLVAGGKIPVLNAVRLAHAVMGALDQIKHGQDLTPDQVKALIGDAMPVALAVAKLAFPGASPALSAGAVVLSMAHKMTPEEEKRWMDRASAVSDSG